MTFPDPIDIFTNIILPSRVFEKGDKVPKRRRERERERERKRECVYFFRTNSIIAL